MEGSAGGTGATLVVDSRLHIVFHPSMSARDRMVVFDFDGTLCDTRAAIAACLHATFEADVGLALDPASVHASIASGSTLDQTLTVLSPQPLPEERLDSLKRSYRARYAESAPRLARLYAGVVDALRTLHEARVPVLVVSNKGSAAIHQSLSLAGVDPWVLEVVGDRPGLAKKPDVALFAQAIHPVRPELDPSDVIMVGDTETDIEFARRAGMQMAWAAYGYGRPEACRAMRPDVELAQSEDLAGSLHALL